uniref:RNA polymerase subunit beta n=1 Tax=Hydrocytium acuminatum TaxID=1745963 RepID=UPI002A82BA18|nr:RNA polymerase subunit beta [Hydrocytium acuminatum]WOR09555.1 RNA polymerase subunit beta [Hydrocytium acuminatum]
MFKNTFLIPDLLEFQTKSFFRFLQDGLEEEFEKRNPITSADNDYEIWFFPEYLKLFPPRWDAKQSILYSKTYGAEIWIPIQIISQKGGHICLFEWVCIGNLPLMTKRGSFIFNGSPRVVLHQIIRGPGIYYHIEKKNLKNEKYYAEIIPTRGTWIRLSIDKKIIFWFEMKKQNKILLASFLLGMGLTSPTIYSYLGIKNANLLYYDHKELDDKDEEIYIVPGEVWKNIFFLLGSENLKGIQSKYSSRGFKGKSKKNIKTLGKKWFFQKFMNPRTYDLGFHGRLALNRRLGSQLSVQQRTLTQKDVLLATHYLFQFKQGLIKEDDIDHLKNKRVRSSSDLIQIQMGMGLIRLEKTIREKFRLRKLQNSTKPIGESYASFFMNSKYKRLSEIRLTDLDITKKFYGFYFSNKNKNNKENNSSYKFSFKENLIKNNHFHSNHILQRVPIEEIKINASKINASIRIRIRKHLNQKKKKLKRFKDKYNSKKKLSLTIKKKKKINTKKNKNRQNVSLEDQLNLPNLTYLLTAQPLNEVFKEFFGTSPLSQFMDQINPLAEITHKRRVTCLGPSGIARDTATMAVRGIHPTYYGRICPIETPEGKNAGLVNSLTTWAQVNFQGLIETPFHLVFKGQIQKKIGFFFFNAENSEEIIVAPSDLAYSKLSFLPKGQIPVQKFNTLTFVNSKQTEFIGVFPIQIISIATSLVPFLEHDDANRALMGANMQRQAVPLFKAERPIVGTGLEAKVMLDSGYGIIAKYGGLVRSVNASSIQIDCFI